MRSLRIVLGAATLAVTTLFTAGCERAIFGFANRGLPPPEATVTFAPELGLSLDIYRPQGTNAKSVPIVLFFYGGGWQRGQRAQYRFVGRRLAQQGVLAIVADYRTFPRAGFPDFIDDAAQAVAWTRQHAAEYGGDPQRLYIAGHSAGAQIAALLGTDPRYLSRHDLRPRDLAGVIGLAGPYDFVINGQYTKVFGPPAQWPQAQAINFVDGNEPPFLLIHGDKDRVVEVRDSIELDAKLRAQRVATTLLILRGGGHDAPLAALYDPNRTPAVMPAIEAFIEGQTATQAAMRR
jgi:acetyl esterase/lipase